jgi:hypothetical protein
MGVAKNVSDSSTWPPAMSRRPPAPPSIATPTITTASPAPAHELPVVSMRRAATSDVCATNSAIQAVNTPPWTIKGHASGMASKYERGKTCEKPRTPQPRRRGPCRCRTRDRGCATARGATSASEIMFQRRDTDDDANYDNARLVASRFAQRCG